MSKKVIFFDRVHTIITNRDGSIDKQPDCYAKHGFGIIRGMERMATDTYSFERIREGGFVYVDKTAILKTLADGSLGTQFFVARPRRFGVAV